jgi:hypothetical protein
MAAIAVASVVVALVAAAAYAGPKIYWYTLQARLLREQSEAEEARFEALKEVHEKEVGLVDTPKKSLGQYL